MLRSRAYRKLETDFATLMGLLHHETVAGTERQRKLDWLRVQVTQWRDNEDTKSLPPMRRDEVVFQIRKSEIRRDAYDQVLQMIDNPVPYYFGREDDDADGK